MILFTLNEHIDVTKQLESYISELKENNPSITDEEINYILKAIFFNGHDGGVTESIITDFIETLDEGIMDIILKSGTVKKLQKKANKIKIEKAKLSNQGEAAKDKVDTKLGRATDDKTKVAKEKAKSAVEDKVKTQKEILTKKETELETRASDKAGSDEFLTSYKATIKHKGEIDALNVELDQASEKEKIEIQRAIKEKKQKIAQEKQDLKKAAQEEKEKEKKDSSDGGTKDIEEKIKTLELDLEAKEQDNADQYAIQDELKEIPEDKRTDKDNDRIAQASSDINQIGNEIAEIKKKISDLKSKKSEK